VKLTSASTGLLFWNSLICLKASENLVGVLPQFDHNYRKRTVSFRPKRRQTPSFLLPATPATWSTRLIQELLLP